MNTFDLTRQTKLNELKKAHAYRSRMVSESPQQAHQVLNGKKVINFASNDYLGLANHPKIKQAYHQGVDSWGVGSGAAHLINGHSQAHQLLEEALAEFTNRPRALLFSSGYSANLALLNSLYDKNCTLYQDKLNHASLIDAGLSSAATFKRYKHKNTQHLQTLLQANQTSQHAIITDGVFSMDGDIAPLNKLASIAQQHYAELVIDDAHGFGVLGKTGAGSCEHFALTAEQAPVYMATLGKAVGCYGAFVAGSETLIETLINQARNYIFTTATPPALAEAARESLNIIQSESWRRDKLNDNIQFFKNLSQQKGLETIASDTAIQPIIIGDNERLLYIKQQLFEKGFLIGAIRPPTVPKGTARIRITLTAEHEQKDIQVLLDLLEQFR